MINNIVVTGQLMNIKRFENERGVMFRAQITQRNESNRAVFTMPIVIFDADAQGFVQMLEDSRHDEDKYTAEVIVSGTLDTKFGAPNEEKKPPFTRIVASKVELAV